MQRIAIVIEAIEKDPVLGALSYRRCPLSMPALGWVLTCDSQGAEVGFGPVASMPWSPTQRAESVNSLHLHGRVFGFAEAAIHG